MSSTFFQLPHTNGLQLFNTYADSAEYYDICLEIYNVADHRDEANINATWQNLLNQTHNQVDEVPPQQRTMQPYEAVINMIRDMSHRLAGSEMVMNSRLIIPMIEAYAYENNGTGPRNWAVDLFISVQFPFENILTILQSMYYNESPPFIGRSKKWLASHMLYTVQQWYDDCLRNNARIFGGDAQARDVSLILNELRRGLDPAEAQVADELQRRIAVHAIR